MRACNTPVFREPPQRFRLFLTGAIGHPYSVARGARAPRAGPLRCIPSTPHGAPLKTIKINPAGGPITVHISSANAHPGTYQLLGWDPGAKEATWVPNPGNFDTAVDDTYQLPGASGKDSVGRVIAAVVTLNVIPPPQGYETRLEVFQDGKRLGHNSASGKSPAKKTLTMLLQVNLVAGGPQ